MSRRLLGLTALVGLTALAATLGAPAQAGSPTLRFVDSAAYTGDIGEPSVAVGRHGEYFVSTPGGGGAVYAASYDQGKHWTKKRVITPEVGQTAAVAKNTSGSDSDVSIAPNGDVVVGDLAIDGIEVSRSTDGGRTFPQQTFVPTGSADREWVLADGANGQNVYVAYHELATGTMLVSTSSDGGKTFLPPRPIYTAPQTIVESAHNGTSIGQISADGKGSVYVTYGTTRPDTTDTTYGTPPISTIHVSVSRDSGLTWNDYLVQPGAPDANYGNFWMASAVDSAGNVYAVYSGYAHKGQRQHVWLQSSDDHGVTWSPAYRVDDLKGNSLFGWVAGGGPGVAVVAYYHTDSANKDSKSADWVTQVAQVRGMTIGRPSEVVGNASTHINHHGGICTLGIFCGVLPGSSADRSMLDFFKVAVDRKGMAVVSFSDNADGRNQVTVARQTSGPSAFAAKI